MKKCFRYMLRLSLRVYAAALVCFAIPLLWGALAGFPAPADRWSHLFLTLPTNALLFLTVYRGTDLGLADLTRALCFGARRQDYFRSFLCITALNVLLAWGVMELYVRLPGLLGLGAPFGKICFPSLIFPLMLLTAHCACGAIGTAWQEAPPLAIFLLALVCGCLSAISHAYEVVEKNGIFLLKSTVSGPAILICIFLLVLSLTCIHSAIKTATVR